MKVLCAVALSLVAFSGVARAEMVAYVGVHPVSPKFHKGLCHIEGPHYHAYVPHKKVLYVRAGNAYAYVGDPTEFEPKVKGHRYYGHHPVFWVDIDGEPVEEYCYITGAHRHLYAPPAELEFKVKGDVYWYVGGHPRWYKRRRHRRLDRYYARVHLVRPVVEVRPPSGFVGVYAGPRGVRGGGYVAGPSVNVGINVPVPSIGISIGGGGGRRVVRRRRRRVVHVVDDGPDTVVVHRRHRKYKRHKRRGPPGHAPAWGYRGKKRKKRKH